MKNFILISFLTTVFVEKSRCAPGYSGEACMVEYLKKNGKLESDYPMPPGYNEQACSTSIASAIRLLGYALEDKLAEIDTGGCLIRELRNSSFVDYMIKIEVIDEASHIKEEDQKRKTAETREKIREILEEAARKCNSKGNDTSIVRREKNFCTAKYVLDNKYLVLENFNVNPKNISTTNIDCDGIINDARNKTRNEYKVVLETKGLADHRILCVMRKFETLKVFDWGLAIAVLERIEASEEEMTRNSNIIEEKYNQIKRSIMSCY